MIPYYFYIYYISLHDFGAIRLLELTSIYLLRKRHIKLVAERSYYLRCGQGNLLQNVPVRMHSGHLRKLVGLRGFWVFFTLSPVPLQSHLNWNVIRRKIVRREILMTYFKEARRKENSHHSKDRGNLSKLSVIKFSSGTRA